MTADRDQRGLAALAALATFGALLPITTLVTQTTWVANAMWLIVAVAGVGMLARQWAGRALVVLPLQLLTVLTVSGWFFAPTTTFYGIPLWGTVSRLVGHAVDFAATVAMSSAPLPSRPSVHATIAMCAALVAIIVDHIAVTLAAPAAAGIALLSVFLTAAANSSDTLSTWFFVIAASTWLLLLGRHTAIGMRRWAQASSAHDGSRVLGSAADARTRFGMVARRLGAAAVLAAVALAIVLPHLPTRFVLDGLARGDRPGGVVRVGFNSTLDVSRSLTSGTRAVVLRYRTTASSPSPLRVLATSRYDGGSWTRPAPSLGPVARLTIAPSVVRSERTLIVQDYTLDPPSIATPQPVTAADLGSVSWQVDEQTSDVHASSRPNGYSTTYLDLALSADLLRNGVDGQPGPDPLPTDGDLLPSLQVDRTARPAVAAAVAEAVPSAASTPYDRALAIQEWLRSTGGFIYTLQLSDSPATGAVTDPMTTFLQTKRGYCVQFSSAMILMAREVGIPARMAIGFLPGTQENGLYSVTAADAHSWPELYFPGAGWVRFEPTPGARSGTAPAYSLPTRTTQPTSSASGTAPREDLRERPQPTDAATGAPQNDARPWTERLTSWLSDPMHLVLIGLGLGLLGGFVLPLTALILRRSRVRVGGPPAHRAEAHWEVLTTRLSDLGLPPPPGGTLRDWEAHFALHGYLDGTQQEALGRVVSTMERARYARPGAELDPEVGTLAAGLVAAIAHTRSWRHRVRAFLWPRDARAWWSRIGRRGSAPVRRAAASASALGGRLQRVGRRRGQSK